MPRIIAQESNKKLRREYRLRFVTMAMSMVATSVVVSGVLLIPAYVLLNSYHEAYTRPELGETREVERLNEEYTSKLSETHDLSGRILQSDAAYMDAMSILFSYAQEGVAIEALDLSRSGEVVSVTLRGSSATREGLLAFEKSILANKQFSGFNLPLETLTRQSDIDFNVTFTYNEK